MVDHDGQRRAMRCLPRHQINPGAASGGRGEHGPASKARTTRVTVCPAFTAFRRSILFVITPLPAA